jgi:mRNA interferase MazF
VCINEHSPLTIVAAVTSSVSRRGPTSILLNAPEGGLTVNSIVLLNQIRSIDQRCLVKRLGRLRPETMKLVDQAIQISLGLIDL